VQLLVHVHTIPLLFDESRVADASGRLSEVELDRASRFHRARDRERYVVAHAETRRVLALHTGADPQALEFTTVARGKPVIASPSTATQWTFNLSHSGDYALLAAARDVPLGVDIEEKRSVSDLHQVAERFFSAAEREMLASAVEPPNDVFFAIWTRKEAVIKALGHGLTMPLADFDVCEPGHWHTSPVFRLDAVDGVPIPREGWQVLAIATPEGYAGALAVIGASGVQLCIHPPPASGRPTPR
jgi:4'-phosphopantetheinyl transferase